ncbi:MAG: VOC family protein [Ramlibacter sp.]
MAIQPYLFFNGHCEEAFEFYKKALDAQVTMLMRFRENPDPPPPGQLPPGLDDKVMHASLRIGDAELMASDGMGTGETSFSGFSISVTARDEAEVDRFFNALSEGGKVEMPVGKTFWAQRFGMVRDKFGLGWMVSTAD